MVADVEGVVGEEAVEVCIDGLKEWAFLVWRNRPFRHSTVELQTSLIGLTSAPSLPSTHSLIHVWARCKNVNSPTVKA